MSSNSTKIIEAIREIAGVRNDNKVKLFQAIVNSVDLDTLTCNVTTVSGNARITYDNIQLAAGICDGNIKIPVIDSLVYIISSIYCEPFIVQYSDIKGIQLSGNEFGGMVKVIELTQKVNNLENKLNDLLAQFNQFLTDYGVHTHPTAPSGPISPPSAPTTATTPPDLTLTERAEIENETITHGEGTV